MSPSEQAVLADEIFERQPALMDSCLIQHSLDVANDGLQHTTAMLLVCFQAMKESGFEWQLISHEQQQRQLSRMTDTIGLSRKLADPNLSDGVTQQYLMSHPEQPLMAYVLAVSNFWLQQIAARGTEAESDREVLMACINFVNCIAYTEAKVTRA
jgi:hypothetical protein